jgi:diguanylate cyclase
MIEYAVLFVTGLVTGGAIGFILFRSGGTRAAPGAGGTPDAREERIEASAGALRQVLLRMADAVHTADTAADAHSDSLGEARGQISRLTGKAGLEEAQAVFLKEIDRVISANSALRGELASARETLREQRKQIESLRTAVRIDPLTGIHNRAAFDERLGESWQRYERYEEVFSLLMLDVDHFKIVNDTYGHQVGDRLLKSLSQTLKATLRGTDFLARYGGEEFGVILPKSDLETGRSVAQKLRSTIEETKYTTGLDQRQLNVTMSVGAASAGDAADSDALLNHADKALYRAKEEGRNRVRAHEPGASTAEEEPR